jgi:hypothetical protein
MNDEERYAAEMARMDRAMKGGGNVSRPVFGKAAVQSQPKQESNSVTPRNFNKQGENFLTIDLF